MMHPVTRLALLIALAFATACASPKPEPVEPSETRPRKRTTSRPMRPGDVQRGMASWYGKQFQGRPTASGERFDRNKLTCAHKTLPLGSRIRVVHSGNGRSVVVRVNDRGPYSRRRIVDLSEAAARRLRMIDQGVAPVTLHVLSVPGRR
jgi:rare lipoprotein A